MKLLKRNLRPAGDRIITKIEKLDSRQFYPFQARFYQSGTAALASAVIASTHGKSNLSAPEVILPAYGCPDLISAIVYAGAKPVLADLDPNSSWMSIEKIKSCITENSVALIAVNFLGIPERMKNLRDICDQHGLILIEDSAQGFPKDTPDKYWRGDYNIISFSRGKPVNMLAGGAVLTSKPELINYLPSPTEDVDSLSKSLKYVIKAKVYNFIITPEPYNLVEKLPWLSIGETTYKPLPGIQSIPQPVLKRLSLNINSYRHKNNIAHIYQKAISKLDQDSCHNLFTPAENNSAFPLLRFPLLIHKKKLRNVIFQELKSFGASIMYRTPLPAIPGISNFVDHNIETYPNALGFANSLLTLPTHEDVTNSDIRKILSILADKVNNM